MPDKPSRRRLLAALREARDTALRFGSRLDLPSAARLPLLRLYHRLASLIARVRNGKPK